MNRVCEKSRRENYDNTDGAVNLQAERTKMSKGQISSVLVCWINKQTLKKEKKTPAGKPFPRIQTRLRVKQEVRDLLKRLAARAPAALTCGVESSELAVDAVDVEPGGDLLALLDAGV